MPLPTFQRSAFPVLIPLAFEFEKVCIPADLIKLIVPVPPPLVFSIIPAAPIDKFPLRFITALTELAVRSNTPETLTLPPIVKATLVAPPLAS